MERFLALSLLKSKGLIHPRQEQTQVIPWGFSNAQLCLLGKNSLSKTKIKYLGILKIEIEDLIKDIELLIEVHKKKYDNQEITQYVYRENIAVLKNEVSCLKNFIECIDSIDAEKYQSLQELVDQVEVQFKTQLHEHSYAQAVESFVKRKLKKVSHYMECE